VLLLGVVAGQWALWQGPQTSARPFVQLDLDVGPDGVSQPALSPDGSVVVFVSKNRLVMRRLDQTANTVLVGTEGASFPFFSPDGKSVAFFADRKIKRIALQGGAPIPICDIATNRGGSWVEDGFIIAPMESLGGLWRIPVAGGTPQPLTSIKGDPEGMVAHRWPQVLPGGKGVLFAATSGTRGSLRVEAGGNVKTLVRNSTYGRLLPSGHLIYYQAGALFAAPMSLDSLELTGPAVALVERVAYTANVANAHFDVAPSGTLAYIRGAQETGRVVSWLDSAGRVAPILPKPADYDFLRLSPDGKRLAVMLAQEGKVDLWVYDLAREGFRQITFDGVGKAYPVWTPDPAFILFTTQSGLSWIRADGSGKVGRLEAAMVRPFPWSLSSDGARLAFADATGIRTLSMERTPAGLRLGQPEPPFQNGGGPAVSPDGRFLAYHSLPLGRSEINVMPFPGAAGTGDESRAGRWPISNEGGTWAIWPRSGREIFYVGPDRRIRAVSYTIQGNSFVSEKPRVWSENILADVGNGPNFDMDSSGQRAVVLIDPSGGESKPETQLRILLNLDDELSRRIAAPVRP
jgi:serine/threonine-protein kinase